MFSIERMHYFRASTVRDPTMITTDISGYLKYIYFFACINSKLI